MADVVQLATLADPFLACCLCGQLLRDPVQLTCLHCCCQSCYSEAASTSESGNVTCSSCGDVTNAGAQLPNGFIIQQVERYMAIAQSRMCGACKENGAPEKPAQVWCAACEHSLCGDCLPVHGQYRAKHITQSLEELSSLDDVCPQSSSAACSAHKKPLEIACMNCEQAKCLSCWADCQRNKHEILFASDDAFENYVGKFIALIYSEESALLHKAGVLENQKSLLSDLRAARNHHLEQINHRKRRIMDVVDAAYQEIESLAKNAYDGLEKEVGDASVVAERIALNVVDARNYIRRLFEMNSKCLILNQQRIVRERLRALSGDVDAVTKMLNDIQVVNIDSTLPEDLEAIIKAWIGTVLFHADSSPESANGQPADLAHVTFPKKDETARYEYAFSASPRDENAFSASPSNDSMMAEKVEPADATPSVLCAEGETEVKQSGRSEDQWSPISSEGKIIYGREFLLTLQHAKQCFERPARLNLPELTSIALDKPLGVFVEKYDFTPGYDSHAAAPRASRERRGKSDRDRRRPVPPDVGPLRKDVGTSRKEVQLHCSDCAYKPLHMKSNNNITQSEKLARCFISTLNKVTLRNVERISLSVLALPFDTEEDLRSFVNLTFENAVSYPVGNVSYATMCKSISSIEVATDRPGELVDFRQLLLLRCQREFENDLKDENDSKAKLEALKKEENNEIKKRLQEEYDVFVFTARRRLLGNIRFIAELFKQKMLTEAIMHDCIVKLLKNNEEDSLECLCDLLQTIGKDIDHENAKPRTDQYFTQMKKIITQKKLSTRVRFKLQDIVDQRENNWVPRFADNNLTNIEQIYKDVAMVMSQASGRVLDGGFIGHGWERYMPKNWSSHDKRQRINDGWHATGQVKMIQHSPKIDASKMKLSKQSVSYDIHLGPGGGRPITWAQRSRPRSSQELKRPTTPSRILARGSTPEDGSQEYSLSTECHCDNDKPKHLSDEDIKKKATTILNEFLHNVDVKKALQSIEELQQPANIDVLVRSMIMGVFERSQKATEGTAQLLSEAMKSGLITTENYLEGLSGVTKVAHDLAEDVSYVWTYLSDLIAPMLQADCLKMNSIFPTCQQLLGVDCASELLVKVLQKLTRNLGAERVAYMWCASGLKWSTFLGSGHDVKSFLTRQNLEFLLEECKPDNVHGPVCLNGKTDTITSKLEDILIRSSGSNEDVYYWHAKNIQDDPTKQRAFIRALVECVAWQAIEQTGRDCTLHQKDLQRRAPLLERFIDKNSELELQALFALQSLVHRLQQPANTLRSMFDWLFHQGIISKETFYRWQKNDDPYEQEGKAVALDSTKQFFSWLQNAD